MPHSRYGLSESGHRYPDCSGRVYASSAPQYKFDTFGDNVASLISLKMEWYFVLEANDRQVGRRHEALLVPNNFLGVKLLSVMCEAKLSTQLRYPNSLKMWNENPKANPSMDQP